MHSLLLCAHLNQFPCFAIDNLLQATAVLLSAVSDLLTVPTLSDYDDCNKYRYPTHQAIHSDILEAFIWWRGKGSVPFVPLPLPPAPPVANMNVDEDGDELDKVLEHLCCDHDFIVQRRRCRRFGAKSASTTESASLSSVFCAMEIEHLLHNGSFGRVNCEPILAKHEHNVVLEVTDPVPELCSMCASGAPAPASDEDVLREYACVSRWEKLLSKASEPRSGSPDVLPHLVQMDETFQDCVGGLAAADTLQTGPRSGSPVRTAQENWEYFVGETASAANKLPLMKRRCKMLSLLVNLISESEGDVPLLEVATEAVMKINAEVSALHEDSAATPSEPDWKQQALGTACRLGEFLEAFNGEIDEECFELFENIHQAVEQGYVMVAKGFCDKALEALTFFEARGESQDLLQLPRPTGARTPPLPLSHFSQSSLEFEPY